MQNEKSNFIVYEKSNFIVYTKIHFADVTEFKIVGLYQNREKAEYFFEGFKEVYVSSEESDSPLEDIALPEGSEILRKIECGETKEERKKRIFKFLPYMGVTKEFFLATVPVESN